MVDVVTDPGKTMKDVVTSAHCFFEDNPFVEVGEKIVLSGTSTATGDRIHRFKDPYDNDCYFFPLWDCQLQERR